MVETLIIKSRAVLRGISFHQFNALCLQRQRGKFPEVRLGRLSGHLYTIYSTCCRPAPSPALSFLAWACLEVARWHDFVLCYGWQVLLLCDLELLYLTAFLTAHSTTNEVILPPPLRDAYCF